MSQTPKDNKKSTNTPKHNVLGWGILIGVIIAAIVISAIFLITNKSTDFDNSYDVNMLERVASAITYYRANNNGKFPVSSKCEVKTTAISDLVDDEARGACAFIKNYLNSPYSDTSEFVDSKGKPYSLIIREVNNMSSPNAHTFAIYPNGRCGSDKVIVSRDSFAVSYKADSDADMICIEESLNAYYTLDE